MIDLPEFAAGGFSFLVQEVMHPFRIFFVDETSRLDVKHEHGLNAYQVVAESLTLKLRHIGVHSIDLVRAHRVQIVAVAIGDVFEFLLIHVLVKLMNLFE